MKLIAQGIATLWARILAADPLADSRPLLLSYDVHPTPDGSRPYRGQYQCRRRTHGDTCRPTWQRLLRRLAAGNAGGATARVVPPRFAGAGRAGEPVDRVYWRSTDFQLSAPVHTAVLQAVSAGTTVLAPSPQAYRAIAGKRRFIECSKHAELARDATNGQSFRIAETLPMSVRRAGRRDAHAGQRLRFRLARRAVSSAPWARLGEQLQPEGLAALAMSMSSASVVGNALRLRGARA